jgi:gamma-glutamyltranspeptidase/glutathione hydrolase
MKGVEEAHKKFGSIPFEDLFENAIKIAEKGRPWNDEDEYNYGKWEKVLSRFPSTISVFTKTDGTDFKIGDSFRQPELVRTLKK